MSGTVASGTVLRFDLAAPLAALLLLLPADARPELLPVSLALAAAALLVPGPPCGRAGAWLAAWCVASLWSGIAGPAATPAVDAALRVALCAGAWRVACRSEARWLPVIAAAAALFHGLNAAWQHWISLPAAATALADAAAGDLGLVRQRLAGGRAFSTFILPGHLGAALAALLVILVPAVVAARGTRRALLGGAALAAVLGLVSAGALGGLVALALVALPWGLRHRSRPARAVLLAVLALAAFVVARRAPDLINLAASDNPIVPRLAMWARGLDVAREQPLSGVGLGAYPEAWLRHAEPGDVPARNAHMSWLEMAAESGIPTLVLLAGFLFASLRRPRSLPAALAAAVLAVHACGDFTLQSSGLAPLLFLLAGLASSRPEAEDQAPGTAPRPALALAGLLALAAVAASARERGRPGVAVGGELAVTDLERAVEAWPWDARARGELARRKAAKAELDAALEQVLVARALAPRAAWLAATEGEIRLGRGEAFAAWFAWRDAERAFPARSEYRETAAAIEGRLEQSRPGSRASGAR